MSMIDSSVPPGDVLSDHTHEYFMIQYHRDGNAYSIFG